LNILIDIKSILEGINGNLSKEEQVSMNKSSKGRCKNNKISNDSIDLFNINNEYLYS